MYYYYQQEVYGDLNIEHNTIVTNMNIYISNLCNGTSDIVNINSWVFMLIS